MLTSALDFLIVMVACALNEKMQRKLDYTQEEVRVLKAALENTTGHKRIQLTNAQRRVHAVKGMALNAKERKRTQKNAKERKRTQKNAMRSVKSSSPRRFSPGIENSSPKNTMVPRNESQDVLARMLIDAIWL